MKKEGFQIIVVDPDGREVFSVVVDEVNYGIRKTEHGNYIMVSNKSLMTICNRCKGVGQDGYKGTNKCGKCTGSGYIDLYQNK